MLGLLLAAQAFRDGARDALIDEAVQAFEARPLRFLVRLRLHPTPSVGRTGLAGEEVVAIEVARALYRADHAAAASRALGELRELAQEALREDRNAGEWLLARLLWVAAELEDAAASSIAARLLDLARGERERALRAVLDGARDLDVSSDGDLALTVASHLLDDDAQMGTVDALRALVVTARRDRTGYVPERLRAAHRALEHGELAAAARELEPLADQDLPDHERRELVILLARAGAPDRALAVRQGIARRDVMLEVCLAGAFLDAGRPQAALERLAQCRRSDKILSTAIRLAWETAGGEVFEPAVALISRLIDTPHRLMPDVRWQARLYLARCLLHAGATAQSCEQLEATEGPLRGTWNDQDMGIAVLAHEARAARDGVAAAVAANTPPAPLDALVEGLAPHCANADDVAALERLSRGLLSDRSQPRPLIAARSAAIAVGLPARAALTDAVVAALEHLEDDSRRSWLAARLVRSQLARESLARGLEWTERFVADPETRIDLLKALALAAAARGARDIAPATAALARTTVEEAMPSLREPILEHVSRADSEHTYERLGDVEPAVLVDLGDTLRACSDEGGARTAFETALERLRNPESRLSERALMEERLRGRDGSPWDGRLRAHSLITAKLRRVDAARAVAATVVDDPKSPMLRRSSAPPDGVGSWPSSGTYAAPQLAEETTKRPSRRLGVLAFDRGG